jgi:hypothetical protein
MAMAMAMSEPSHYAVLAQDLPPDILEEWAERVAIMMEGDKISQYRAEGNALELVKKKYQLSHRGHKYIVTG